MVAGDQAIEQLQTTCCIVGGGPAGMMLGYLLARAGIDVVVLEKHGDFLRDFRGDTIHPSTLEVMYELGLLDEFLKRPHQEVTEFHGRIGAFETTVADLRRLPTHCKFIAFMPQWDFLNFMADHARQFPGFHLRMQADATELLYDDDRIVGVRAQTPNGPLEVRATLTVAADGRHSVIRQRAGLTVREYGVPIDVLWMQISRRPDDPFVPLGNFDQGRILVLLYRGDYWQCAFVIHKGGFEEIRQRGLDFLRREIAEITPFLSDRVHELRDWDDVKLLTVKIDRLQQWHRPGLLCIGDAAHAMSPVGGVGINLAIQDAVATANLLTEPLRRGNVSDADLARVQHRRLFPTRMTQRLQTFVHNHVIKRALESRRPISPPRLVRWLDRWPSLRRFNARLIGMGIRPEHVHTAELFDGH
jgi:2-polyprenyl-6-methoxyphenol hydroxylase-like FAD-dependent oxidoreductase